MSVKKILPDYIFPLPTRLALLVQIVGEHLALAVQPDDPEGLRVQAAFVQVEYTDIELELAGPALLLRVHQRPPAVPAPDGCLPS
ncbi:hypothetical protein WME99_46715 [Sorangium sp. So ce136]|uniref:hypothetical protein n=1 Tax=Sorangium sp. So ce136 TaxID=3133284 RepID=UPI003F068B9A